MLNKLRVWLRTNSKGEYKLGILSWDPDVGEIENRDLRFTITVAFCWYDFWIGLYWDRNDKQLYVCPLPTIAFRIGYQ